MKVVLKHAGRWLHFQCPERVLKAERIEEVLPLLAEAETSGLFAAGFISYEAAPAFDSALKTHDGGDFPLIYIGLFHAPEVLDSIEQHKSGGRGSVRATGGIGSDKTSPSTFSIGELEPSVTKDEFTKAIGEIKERIAEGATYQVNYTYRLNADFSGDAWAFFWELVKGQKTEYAAFIETDDFAVCSASPELFFSYSNGVVTSRPMKGTAKRGRTFAEDWKQAEALRESEKDRAENIMIVDMIRNDIGRIAEPGSVETLSTFDVEKYPTVWQMTSTVKGNVDATPSSRSSPHRQRDGGVASTIFSALFPCASITGAPKAKTMEIIRELEQSPRKIYTGAIGFLTPQGEACFNVAIRTALVEWMGRKGAGGKRGRLEFGVGGGIVWDSDADAEYDETRIKARVLTQPRPEFKLLETMLWEPDSGIFLLDEHLQRLAKSAAYFDIPVDMHAVRQALVDFDHTCAGVIVRVRLLVSRDGNPEIQTFPIEAGRALSMKAPRTDHRSVPTLRVTIAKIPVDSQDIFLFHKTTHRAVYEKAKIEGFDDVILWNEKGEVTESTIANVVIRKNGKLITPPVECGLLAGTFREMLLKSGEVEEGIISVDELKTAEEVFLVNSVRKWQKAVVEQRESGDESSG